METIGGGQGRASVSPWSRVLGLRTGYLPTCGMLSKVSGSTK